MAQGTPGRNDTLTTEPMSCIQSCLTYKTYTYTEGHVCYTSLCVPLIVFKSSSEDEVSEEEEEEEEEEEVVLEPSGCAWTSALFGLEARRLLQVLPDLSSFKPYKYKGRPGYIQADVETAAKHVGFMLR